MSINKGYQTYQHNAVHTASSGELTLMLYNGCIKFIKQAMKDIDEHNYEAKNNNIQKAQNIIQELMLTLDPKIEISKQILPLYEYMHHLLKEANIQNEITELEEVLQLVSEFRDTWKQVILKNRKTEQSVQGAQV
ncbi:flagellar export chaperone FliS [Virgibacillus alimentarius]|uniref:Flagellar secretion chaperone FliS n=1 Tax=Virgibacillus alimentarius TaxID=698769 RepID=A0ABS4S5P0_9BACI|nr:MULTISPECIES: flagellar export chaperone FliS [Virgibacillus]MBP2256796.1 flagellar protein FliS [Virgibacillus alimentarius]HLR65665.1 flagellar export chaperone FliS [Virgibacillus sp.]